MAGPLRIGLVGCGRIAGKHVEAMLRSPEQFTLAAVCDADPAAAQRVADEAGLPASCIYTDAAALIRHPDLHAVDLCTIHDQHHPQALAAFDRGLHVLVEKPLAISMRQCTELVQAAAQAGRTLMVAHNQRFKANYRALRAAIAAGELGDIRAMRAESAMNVLNDAPPGHWVYDGRRAGGGVAISLGLHRIDLFRFLAGELSRVTSAVCRTFEPRFTHGAEDYAFALLDFAAGGVAEMFATYTPWRAPWGESFVVYGSQGTAHAMPLAVKYNDPVLIVSPEHRGPEVRPGRGGFMPLPLDRTGLPTGEPFCDELLHFAACVASGAEPISSGREILGTMRAVFGIYESARRGSAVDLDEICPLPVRPAASAAAPVPVAV